MTSLMQKVDEALAKSMTIVSSISVWIIKACRCIIEEVKH